MCFRDAIPLDVQILRRMRDVMWRRGPDDAGEWISTDGKVGLAHRRLAIIDVSVSARQPMSNEDGNLQIVFNGEIYNHSEIRKELNKTGRHQWKTDHSDTEVILHAFEEWGIDCVHRFRGMFAFALWDNRARTLWMIRDRIGIKPLYYMFFQDRFYFASEIKALLEIPKYPRVIHEESLFHYLSFLTTPAPDTLFSGIKKLPGGTYLKIDNQGKITEKRFWDVWDFVHPITHLSENEIAEQLLQELRDAVRYRCVSDVEVGVFLSGGIDSSTNAVLFAQEHPQTVKTFAIGYERDYGSYQNEFQYARQMADWIPTCHFEKKITVDEFIAFLPEMVYLQDEPIADPVCVPFYYVSKLAKEQGVTVCQSGEGSDELFMGYPWWKSLWKWEKWNQLPMMNWVAQFLIQPFQLMNRRQSLYYEWLERTRRKEPLFWGGAETFRPEEKKRILSPRMRKQFRTYSSWEALKPIHRRFEEKAWEKKPLPWMSYCDLNLRLPELLLMRVDKMSMGVSLECRVPFLDHHLVELAFSLPESVKIKNGELKYILKKSVRGLIPDAILHRPKQGFGVPIYEWLEQSLGKTVRDKIKTFCDATDFLDYSILQESFFPKQDPRIWCLFNLALWWETYF